jgi:hypothetical protein
LFFLLLLSIGETDQGLGTSQASFTASLTQYLANLSAAGFNGRVIIPQESYNSGATSNPVRAAQAAAWNGTTVFSGGDWDARTGAFRQADNMHFNDSGHATIAADTITAMHASGLPL